MSKANCEEEKVRKCTLVCAAANIKFYQATVNPRYTTYLLGSGKREGLIVTILRRFGNLNFTYFSNFGSRSINAGVLTGTKIYTPALILQHLGYLYAYFLIPKPNGLDYSGLSTSQTRIAWAYLEIANRMLQFTITVK